MDQDNQANANGGIEAAEEAARKAWQDLLLNECIETFGPCLGPDAKQDLHPDINIDHIGFAYGVICDYWPWPEYPLDNDQLKSLSAAEQDRYHDLVELRGQLFLEIKENLAKNLFASCSYPVDDSNEANEQAEASQVDIASDSEKGCGDVVDAFPAGAEFHPARRFLELLGKDPDKTWFRTIARGRANPARSGRDLRGLNVATLTAGNKAGEAVYFISGEADHATSINKKGSPTGCVGDPDITCCRAVFVEWDDKPIEWQLKAWQELNLPEPSLMVRTGGKSIHCYWLLTNPMEPSQWRVLQERLITHTGADRACKNPSRLMRLPGFYYIDKETGCVTDRMAELIHQSGATYSEEEIEACLQQPKPAEKSSLQKALEQAAKDRPDLPPRSEAELLKALELVPEFFHDGGRREELLALAQRLHVEWGKERALQWMLEHSPSVQDMEGYFRREPDHISPGSIWPFLRDTRGVDLTRHDLRKDVKAAQPAGTLSLESQLKQLLAEGLSGSALSLRLKSLANEVCSPLRDVERLYRELETELEREAETATTLDELMRLNESSGIDLEELIPSDLLDVLEAMRAFADYRLDVLLAVLMTGLSGALPLDSRIELNAMERFNQPLSLWALLLMPSGEAKSPLLQRLLALPWREAVDTELAEAYEQRREWEAAQQRQQEGGGQQAPLPRPRKPQSLVTEDVTPQGMETHMEIHDQWANRSMCIWLDEGKGALKQMVDRDSSAGKETPFGGWLLSRYDGTGARGAKADQTKERNYKSCRLSMVTCCQPDVYRAITGDGDQTGLSARFIVVEQNLVEQAFPTSVDWNAVAKADKLHETLVRCYRELAQTDQLKLWLSEEAFELFQQERKAMYDRKRDSNSAAERALANKVAGRLGRLAGMFHIIWSLMGNKGEPRLGCGGEVSGENMRRAIRFNRLLLDQTLGVRLTSADNSELAGLMLKLHRRAWEVKKPMPVSDLRKGLTSTKRPEMAEVLQALQELAGRGFGELSEVEHRGRPGWKYTARKPLLDVVSRHP